MDLSFLGKWFAFILVGAGIGAVVGGKTHRGLGVVAGASLGLAAAYGTARAEAARQYEANAAALPPGRE